MRNLFLYSILFLFMLYGCRKTKKDPIPLPVNTATDAITCIDNKSYYPLTKGSYWVYEISTSYPDHSRAVNYYDSCYVVNRDTLIEGKPYALLSTTTTFPFPSTTSVTQQSACRYEGDYVMAEKNYRIFSACISGEPFSTNEDPDHFWTSESRMLAKDTTYTVPAGTFAAKVEKLTYNYPSYQSSPYGAYRNQYAFYGRNTGIIYTCSPYVSNPEIVQEKRLIRYFIQ